VIILVTRYRAGGNADLLSDPGVFSPRRRFGEPGWINLGILSMFAI